MYSSFTQQVWKPKTTVKLRFSLAQAFFIAIIISLLALALYFPVRKRLVSITDSSYQILAYTLAASIYAPMSDTSLSDVNRYSQVQTAVKKIEAQQGVKYVLVIQADNTVFYDSFTGNTSLRNKPLPQDDLSKSPEIQNGNLVSGKITRDNTIYYNYLQPFVVHNEVLYTVRVGVDQQTIEGVFTYLSYLFIRLGILGILVGALASYILAARLTRPIILLTESALAIRAGNLNAYPNITTNDELEQLSREFQSMVERLKQFYFQEYGQKKEAVAAKKQLEDVNTRLQALDRQKSDFLNAASHQLRTPLSVIHWSLSLIVEAAEHLNLSPEQRELLDESLKSTKRMVDLVNDLLDISRIEQGRKELAWDKSNYGLVCEQLVAALQVLAHNKGLELTYTKVNEIPNSFLDEKAFYQVVNNFVDNAIKYTAQGFVHVSCEAKGKEILIKISDSGIGMTQEEKNDLFTRFSRGSEAEKMFPNGSGLGMYVARAILKQHGGSIDVETEKGKGTTFILNVPIYDAIPEKKELIDDKAAQVIAEKTPETKP